MTGRASLALVEDDGAPVTIEERLDALDEDVENIDEYALGLDRRLKAVEGQVETLTERVDEHDERLGVIW